MTDINEVPVSAIDPESAVNVRLTQIEENVQKVKQSIQMNGYWPDQPITLRPHPEPGSGYQYQYVVGKCRFTAALELCLDAIPALVMDLSDDEALRRSWGENEARGELTPGDKAHWIKWAIARFDREGHARKEARKKAAEWLGIGVQQAMKYAAIAFLPEEVTPMMDQGALSVEDGEAIAKAAYGEEPAKTLELAQWVANTPKRTPRRRAARDILQQLGGKIETGGKLPPVSELEQRLQETVGAEGRRIEIEIPKQLYDRFLRYGEENGIYDPATIVSHMIAQALKE